jgi:hypothetical protein
MGASVRLIENTKVLNFRRDGPRILLNTTNGTYGARLVLDASGGTSPFATTFLLHRLVGFYSIYGGHLKNLRLASQDVVAGHIVHFGHPAPIFEVIPTGIASAFCVVFLASKSVIDPRELNALFREHINHNPFFKMEGQLNASDVKMGVIPIGRSTRKILPGILSIGEAGLLQSPLLAAAFNDLLDHADLIANTILTEFSRHPEGIIFPRVRFPVRKIFNDRIQLMLARHLLNGGLASFERLVHFMKELGPQRAYRLFCTQLGWRDIPFVLRGIRPSFLKVANDSV